MRNSKSFVGAAQAAAALLVGVAIALMAGCATPRDLAIGTARSEVLDRFGRPLAVHPLPDGGERFEFDIGPYQQVTWMIDLDVKGKLTRARQVRAPEGFSRVRIGEGPDAVRRELGTPWRIERYPLSALTAWLYPYREAELWNSVMAVYFDDKGTVQRLESGPDPRFLGGSDKHD